MIDYVRKILIGQFEASLAMLNECLQHCPAEHWDGKVARYPFWQIAYHALCFVDLYLSPDEKAFAFRDLHPQGWKEFDDEHPSRRFDKDELIGYAAICRQKMVDTLARETPDSLARESGFHWLPLSRGELHIYNLRHVQHHTGQISAYLRRVAPALQETKEVLRWVRTGWR